MMQAEGDSPLLRPCRVVVYPKGEEGSSRHPVGHRQKLRLEILSCPSN